MEHHRFSSDDAQPVQRADLRNENPPAISRVQPPKPEGTRPYAPLGRANPLLPVFVVGLMMALALVSLAVSLGA